MYLAAFAGPASGQEARPAGENGAGREAATALAFLGGAITGLAAHEASHVALDYAFDARPGVKRVDFGWIPFFAITHREVSRRREFAIASAGFWAQHAVDEWVLTRRPQLRRERAPFAKGALAFGVLTSFAYGGAAFARAGPAERDTRGMALSAAPGGIDERWIGALVLAPAALDAYRYFAPDARWAVWASRVVKVGLVLMVMR
ncbi:MAG TPA: hypothetical protein VK886_13735 [Vicinamibacterales bacterium]|nr:hypothetical protein [Vicinamibacterales bacterium]